MIYACFNSEMSLSCVIWVCLMLDCWLTQCCVDYRTRICQRRYLALLAEIRRQRQAQREREEHEEEERGDSSWRTRGRGVWSRRTCVRPVLCVHNRSVLMQWRVLKSCVCVCVFTGPASPPVPLPRKKKPEPRPRSELKHRPQSAASGTCAAAAQQAVWGVTSVTYPNITPGFMRLPPQPSSLKIIYVPSHFSSLYSNRSFVHSFIHINTVFIINSK